MSAFEISRDFLTLSEFLIAQGPIKNRRNSVFRAQWGFHPLEFSGVVRPTELFS